MATLTPLDIISAFLPKMPADPRVSVFITLAEQRTAASSPEGWSVDKRVQAVALRAMHMWTLAVTRPLGEAGAIQNKQEGELRLGFSPPNRTAKGIAIDPDLEQTSYGRQLIGLIKGTFTGFSLAGPRATEADWDAALWGED